MTTFASSLPILWLALFSVGCLPSCLGQLQYGGAVDVLRIQDSVGADDVIYIRVEHVDGLSAGEYRLTLPADWKERRAVAREGAAPTLSPTFVPSWTPVARGTGLRAAAVSPGEAIPWQLWDQRLTLDEAGDVARERHSEGKDSYWLGPVEESGHPAVWTSELFGARQGAEERTLEWVHICTLEFADSRTRTERKWGRFRNELGAGVGLLIFVGLPVLAWVVILD